MSPAILDLHAHDAPRAALLRANNAAARETSHLEPDRFDAMIAAARIATFAAPDAGFLLGFAPTDSYDGLHFAWFRTRLDRFVYVDRIVIAAAHRRRGLAQALYADLYARARALGARRIACEVNLDPPNPASDIFHAAEGFTETGRATSHDGRKTVRYLVRELS